MDDNIKEAFSKVKEDMLFLREAISENRSKTSEICNIIDLVNKNNIDLNKKIDDNTKNVGQVIKNNTKLIEEFFEIGKKLDNLQELMISTDRQPNQTHSTHPSTDNYLPNPLKDQNIGISNGNEGVSTDRQTDTSTDRQTQNTHKIQEKSDFNSQTLHEKRIEEKDILSTIKPKKEEKMSFDNAIEALGSLNSVKKELRLKIKRLTEQELLIFTTMYQLDEELGYSDYKLLAERLNLSESSIRDYVGRLIKKGIPVDKNKINNKLIQLNISKGLKQIAPLSLILQLREL